MLKATLRKDLNDPCLRLVYEGFCRGVARYQIQNKKVGLRQLYTLLPQNFKDAIKPSQKTLLHIYRGDDGKSDEEAISWTRSKSYASKFGQYLYHYPLCVVGFEAAIDTTRLCRLLHKTPLTRFLIDDDEGEIIIFQIEWKNPNKEQLMLSYQNLKSSCPPTKHLNDHIFLEVDLALRNGQYEDVDSMLREGVQGIPLDHALILLMSAAPRQARSNLPSLLSFLQGVQDLMVKEGWSAGEVESMLRGYK